MIALVASFLIAMGVTWATTPWVAKLAVRCGAVAIPRARDVHDKHTPKWGGIAIYLGVVVAAVVGITARHIKSGPEYGWNLHLVGILLAGTFIALYGLLDDLKDLRALWQIVGILIAGAILIACGVRIEGLSNPLAGGKPGH